MILRNAKIYGTDHQFHIGDVYIDKDRIGSVTRFDQAGQNIREIQTSQSSRSGVMKSETTLDATGLYAVPGLVDIHLHGAAGHDFCTADQDGIRAIAQYEVEHGITAICPATMTLSMDALENICDTILQVYQKQRQSRNTALENDRIRNESSIVGIHLEGPFINADRAGAQNKDYIQKPDVKVYERLQKAAKGLIRQIDIAPEVDGGFEFIKILCNRNRSGISAESDRNKSGNLPRISLAHTNCDYDQANMAFRNGATHVTHAFNAMPGIDKRNPGLLIAAREAEAEIELIADGVHIHPAMVRFAFDYFGDDNVIMISDSMEATGLPDGMYELGGQAVAVHGNRATLAKDISEDEILEGDIQTSETTIAGSVTNLFDCMKIAVTTMGIPFESAVRAATENPAKSIGIFDDYGSIEPGKLADILLVDENLNLVHVIHDGFLLTERGTINE